MSDFIQSKHRHYFTCQSRSQPLSFGSILINLRCDSESLQDRLSAFMRISPHLSINNTGNWSAPAYTSVSSFPPQPFVVESDPIEPRGWFDARQQLSVARTTVRETKREENTPREEEKIAWRYTRGDGGVGDSACARIRVHLYTYTYTMHVCV